MEDQQASLETHDHASHMEGLRLELYDVLFDDVDVLVDSGGIAQVPDRDHGLPQGPGEGSLSGHRSHSCGISIAGSGRSVKEKVPPFGQT